MIAGQPAQPSRRRILFALPDLEVGGAQRVMLTLLRHLSRDRFEPHLALVQRRGQFLGDVPSDVQVHHLGAARVRSAAAPLFSLVWRLRPHVIQSTLSYLNAYVLLLRPFLPPATRLVVRECTATSTARQSWRWPRLAGFGLGLLYRQADAVLCQSHAMREDLARHFGVPRGRMRVIYNPIDVPRVRAAAAVDGSPLASAGPGPHIVVLGRIATVKGFDAAIHALPALRQLFPDAQLWIVGEEDEGGTVQRELMALGEARGVAAHVHFTGYTANPYRYLKHADLFVLPSRAEALSNALLEALACGCPVVALDSPGGTREAMELAKQAHRLRTTLEWDREWFRGAAPSATPDLSAFSVSRALGEYEDLLASL